MRMEMGTSKAASMEITEETSWEISRGAYRATSRAAGRVAIKGGRALVATGKGFRTHSNKAVMAIMAIKGNAMISCSRSCVLTVERTATGQGSVTNSAGVGKTLVIQIKFRTQRTNKGMAHSPRGREMRQARVLQRCPMLLQSKSLARRSVG